MFAHSRDPHPALKLWCQVPFPKSKTTFQIEMYCMQWFLKSRYIKSRTFNDENRWFIKKVMVFKKLLQHLATRGTYSPGDWRCDEAWREQTMVYPPVMCQQRLIYCTWELNVMIFTFHIMDSAKERNHEQQYKVTFVSLFTTFLKQFNAGPTSESVYYICSNIFYIYIICVMCVLFTMKEQ